MFKKVQIEAHFPLVNQVINFRKSLLSFFDEVFLSCTTEKREVLSANKLGLEDKSSGRSLIYIKKNDVPRMGH